MSIKFSKVEVKAIEKLVHKISPIVEQVEAYRNSVACSMR